MDIAEERAAYVALALTPGIGAVRMAALLDHCQTALGALSAPFAFLRTIPGMSPAAATAVSATTPAAGIRALETVEKLGGTVILPGDARAPEILRQMPDPPTVLFALGAVDLLSRPAVAIVGSRDHSDYGEEVCHEVSSAAARAGIVVVSGMARGLDAVAHAAALDAPGTTIGILGNGLGVIYPSANRSLYERVAAEGLLLTEFPPGERPGVGSFPRRNRLISALAQVTVVVEAAEGSGTLITVGTALAQGKDVMAVPGPITSPTSIGTNRLIRDGAEPLLGADDLLRHYGAIVTVATTEQPASAPVARARAGSGPARADEPVAASAPVLVPIPADLSESARRVAESLHSGPARVDGLIGQLGLPVTAVLSA
ncbi:MAG: DNA-processing protein DprA, partial [Gemmatimonadota bacterium]